MNPNPAAAPSNEKPTGVRYGVLGFACSLSMITYLDRVCFGTVAQFIQKEFGLSETQKGLLFTAFALAYAAFEIPSGWLGDVYGPRRTLIRIVLWWSVFTALTGLIFPLEVWPQFAFAAMLAVRFLFGAGEAGAYPNIARAFHNWFPFSQRGFAQGAVWMAGRFAGGITPLIVSALLIEVNTGSDKEIYWRHIFWIFGTIGCLWCALFWWWFRDRPEQNPNVNAAELALIYGEDGPPQAAHAGVPWRKLAGSGNLWILCMMYFCAAYGWYFNITWLPGYLQEFHGVTYEDKWTAAFWTFSLMAGLPLLAGSFACLAGGMLSDRFIRLTGDRKWGRRLFGVIGHSLCALCYFLAIFMTNPWLFVAAIALAAFWNDITMGAAWASCLDIGKKYSGIVAGCMNTVGNLGGAVAGFLTGWIVDLYRNPVVQEHAAATAASAANVFGSVTASAAGAETPVTTVAQTADSLHQLAQVTNAAKEAAQAGWTVNFIIFGMVYVAATILWLFFDPTKPVIPEEPKPKASEVPSPAGD